MKCDISFLMLYQIQTDTKVKTASVCVNRKLAGEEPGQDDVSRVTTCMVWRDITKREPLQACSAVVIIDGCKGKENSPGHEPDREEDDGHHSQETNEKIGIETVDAFNVFIVCSPHDQRPSEEGGSNRGGSFARGSSSAL